MIRASRSPTASTQQRPGSARRTACGDWSPRWPSAPRSRSCSSSRSRGMSSRTSPRAKARVRRQLLRVVLPRAVSACSSTARARRADQARSCAPRPSATSSRSRPSRPSCELMQAQVEPHFLFNTLANVQHLVRDRSRPGAAGCSTPHPVPARGAAADARDSRRPSAARWTWRGLPRDHPHAHGPRLAFAIDVPADARGRTPSRR